MSLFSRLFNRVQAAAAPVVAAGSSAGSGVSQAELIAAVSRWREQYNPLRGLTMAGAIAMLEQAQRGEFADVQWTYSFIERRDPDLLTIIDRRCSALLEMDWDIKTVEARFKTRGLAFDAGLAADQQAMLRAEYDRFSNLYAAIEHLSLATYRGYAHVQFLAQGKLLDTLNILPQWNLLRDGIGGDWYWNPGAEQKTARSLPPDARLDARAYIIRTHPRPVNEIALVKFMRQNLSSKDWDSFLEIYGVPGWIVIMPANIPADKVADYQDAAENVAKGGSGALPNGSDAKCADQPRGVSPFEAHLRYWTERLVQAGTGGLLTVLSMPQGIGSGSSDAHADAFAMLAAADARRISELFQRSVDRYLLDLHFPGRPALAYFELAAKSETDIGQVLDHAVKVSQAGGQVDWTQISEKTGYRLQAQAAPAAPAAPAPLPWLKNRQTISDASPMEPLFRELETLLDAGTPDQIENWIRALPTRAAALDLGGEAEALQHRMEAAAVAALLQRKPELDEVTP